MNKIVFKTHGKWFLIYISIAALAATGKAALVLEMKEHFRKQVAKVFGWPD